MKKQVGIVGLGLLLAACTTVGPDYKRPDPGMASEFHGADVEAQTGSVRPDWWEVLDDPQLTDYIRDAVERNHDLEVARCPGVVLERSSEELHPLHHRFGTDDAFAPHPSGQLSVRHQRRCSRGEDLKRTKRQLAEFQVATVTNDSALIDVELEIAKPVSAT